MLDDMLLIAGDRFHLHFTLGPRAIDTSLDVYILLDVYGQYWCWPDWSPMTDGIQHETYALDAWEEIARDVLDFAWPNVEGEASGLRFVGAAFTENSFELVGDVQVIEFGYE